MPPTTGELNERVNNLEDRVEKAEERQHDLRKPEDGALAQIHEKINLRPTKDDLNESARGIKWFIGVLVTVMLVVVGGAVGYTNSTLAELSQEHRQLKERVDREVVTKQDLQCLKTEIKEAIREGRRNHRD